MHKKSFFRGLGIGLVIGAMTMTVAFNFDSSVRSDAGKGNSVKVEQQGSTESDTSAKDDKVTTEKATTEKASTEKATTEKATTEKSTTQTASTDKTDVADNSTVKDNNDKNSSGTTGAEDGKETDGSSGNDAADNSGVNGKNDVYADGNGGSSSQKTQDSSGGLSDNTTKVPSSKDNGYTEDKNSQTTSGNGSSGSDKTTVTAKPSAIKYDDGGGQITIVDGMSAYEICELLAQIGLRDADEYYDWLLRSGYSDSLVSGTYTFTGNETNGGIVWILLGHQ